MRLSFALIYLLSLLSVNYTNEVKKLKIEHLTEGLYIYTTYKDFNGYMFPSNSMYMVTKEGIVLFDTPWDTTQFQPLLDSIYGRHQKKVVLCIATHYHDDRTAGLEYYKELGILTYTSEQTFHLCEEHHEKKAEHYFTKDTVFEIGGHRFETYYPGKGHTKDNLVIWFEKEKVLYGGCLIKSTENADLGNIADAHLNDWGQTIKNVMNRYPDRNFVIPGHFGWKNASGLEHTFDLLEKHRSRISEKK